MISPTDPIVRRWLRRRLLTWFRAHARDLPWRHTKDAYAIWVSEIMLQQTLVATVVPYYQRFLKRFPTIRALAEADQQDVLRFWEGLGYYRRARHLHLAAQILAEKADGEIPNDPDDLHCLPGFGRYTVGAVLSQAFDQRLPILEANSLRVLCRVFGFADEPTSSAMQKTLWETAEQLLPRRHVGDFNQALMELGALVCTPASPKCSGCPLQNKCVAFQTNRQDELPYRKPPETPVAQREVAVVIRRGAKVLLVQRPDEGRWANLWEFPHGELSDAETPEDAARRFLRTLTGIDVQMGQELTIVQHGVMRFRITLICLEAEYQAGRFRSGFYVQGKWLKPKQLRDFPLSSPQRKLATVLQKPLQQRLF